MLVNFDSLKTFYNALKQKMKNYRGNWNQNDPTADDYIKNRPFYSEGVKEIEILPKTTLNCPSYYGMDDPFKIKLITGTEYTVVFDGVTYKCVARETYEDEPFIGNSSILGWNDNTNTGEPFFIDVCYYDNGESEVTFATTKDGTHTISVSIVEEIVHKLDKKFVPIPDDVVSEDDLADVAFSGDYNDLYNTPTIYDDVVRYGITQSLSEAQKSIARENIGAGTSSFSGDYNDLENKPCSKELVVGETVFNMSGMFTKDSNGIYKATFAKSVSATFDKLYTYELIVNDKTYTCIGPQSSSAGYQFGNTNIFIAPESAMNETAWVLINQSLPSIDIRIKTTTTISGSVSILFKKADTTKYSVLDERYIPGTIARVSDVYNKTETYSKKETYNKEEVYNKDETIAYKNSVTSESNISEIFSANNIFFANRRNEQQSYVYFSNDLFNWDHSEFQQRNMIKDIFYSDGQYIGLFYKEHDNSTSVYRSTDCINWIRDSGFSVQYGLMAIGNDKIIVISADGTGTIIYTNEDGTWEKAQTVPPVMWSCVKHDNNKFIAIDPRYITSSYDGITWNELQSLPNHPTNAGWCDLYCANNKYIITNFGNDSSFLYSNDGITWNYGTAETTGPVCYGNGIFVMMPYMGENNSNIAQYSYDGVTWNSIELPYSSIYTHVCYCNGKFVSSLRTGGYIISIDGVHWDSMMLGNNNGDLTEKIADSIQPYIELTDENIPDTIARVSDIPESASPMVGATSTTDGTTGTVPAPTSTDSTKFLRGDGTWAYVSSSCPIESGVTDILPDKYYTFGTVDSLTINLVDTGDDSKLCEYCFEFIPSENFTGLTITPEPKWAHTIRFIPGMTCQVSILRGIGVMLCA